ncbi:hypothetical protein SAMN06298216_0939 [Spirosomataceae bacterium TFI 002]|nr:hypothetical protein SAMN06298216_0939 [Spirosomataceae bacterium TFI 002]
MTLLYSETLYSLYLNYGKVVQLFYTIVFIWAIFNFSTFQGIWKWFLAYISLSFITEVLVYFTPISEMENNHFVGHISFFIGVIMLGVFFYQAFDKPILKQITLVGTILLNFAVIIGFFYEDGYLLPSKMGSFIYIVFLALHLILHRKLIAESKTNRLRENPMFWWNTSFIIMNIVYIIFSLTIGSILPISDDLSFIWYLIKNTSDLVLCVLWVMAIYKLRSWKFKPTASLSPSQ